MKIENFSSFLRLELNADPKTVLVLFLALIVFDFYSFEIYIKKYMKNMTIVIFSKNISKIKKFSRAK